MIINQIKINNNNSNFFNPKTPFSLKRLDLINTLIINKVIIIFLIKIKINMLTNMLSNIQINLNKEMLYKIKVSINLTKIRII